MTRTAAAPRAPAPPRAHEPVEARRWLKARREELRERYLRRPDPQRALAAHAAVVDGLLARLERRTLGGGAGVGHRCDEGVRWVSA